MSWNLTATVTKDQSVADGINEQIDGNTADEQKRIHEADDQINAAVEAAEALRAAVARDSDTVIVRLSGHYNKNLEPTPGWSDCFVQVHVGQVPVEPVEDK